MWKQEVRPIKQLVDVAYCDSCKLAIVDQKGRTVMTEEGEDASTDLPGQLLVFGASRSVLLCWPCIDDKIKPLLKASA